MGFDLKQTEIMRALKRESFPLFRFALFLQNIFLVLLIVSLCILMASFLGMASGYFAIKLFILSIILYFVFWEISLFVELKIKNPQPSPNLADAAQNPEKYDLAEFLNFSGGKIADCALNLCKSKNLPANSTALLHCALKSSKEISLICYRLGIDAKKLQIDLKNYLEKMPRAKMPGEFLDNFKNAMAFAAASAKQMGHQFIGEKEILVGVSKADEFFKKVLVDNDLKEIDIENLAIWLDSGEDQAKRAKQFWSKENLARQGSLGKDWASGYTINLDQYSVDWRNVVRHWMFREIVGHKKEIEQVEMILARSNQSNALIVGDPGTGRKSIVQAIAQKCFLGNSLPELNNKRVVELDLVTLVAQVQSAEKLEAILDEIFSEVASSGNVILVIDELQNFVGQKENKPGQADISGILSKYLPIPNFQFIAITDYAGLHKNIEQSPSFANFFRKVEVGEVSEAETIQILQSAGLEYEYKNKILILYPALREIANLTDRYMPSLPFPKKALDVLDEVVVYVNTLKERIVLPHHVAEIISQKTDIPVGKMDLREKETLLNLENLIHQRLVNQQEAVREISVAMRRARAGISSKKRPMGTFLFMGPTGVGKTETAKALAQIYFGSEDKMIRLDMSEFQAVSDIPRLIGAISPLELQGILTTPVRETPFSLVLLDEIEKSHPNILNLFLQIFDEGHITDGQGRKVVFTNTIIICTSNAGADMIFKSVESGEKLAKEKIIDALISKGTFKPEFINRFDAAIIFHPLTKENLLQIAQLSLQSLQKNLKEKEIDFEITEALKQKIVDLSYKPEFGAREMRRVIQDNIENAVAQALLADTLKKGDRFHVDPENFGLVINGVDNKAAIS